MGSTWTSSVRAAARVMAGAMLSFWSVLAVRDAAGLSLDVVVLAVCLAVMVGRVLPELAPAARVAGLVVVPVATVAATEVGVLWRTHPDGGDAVFVVALAAGVWVRRFGRAWGGAGTLLGLPFVAALVAPLPQPAGLRHLLWSGLSGAIAVGWVGLAYVAADPPGTPHPPSRVRARGSRLPPSTRMAVQLAAALAAALVIGRVWYPDHWVWPVLSAYIVCSGNRGRTDVLHKGVQRVVGALAGTLLASALLVGVFGAGSPAAVACVFAALAVAVVLRPHGYAYWAGCVTAALAFLYGYFGQTGSHVLYTRLAGIAWGGAAAIVASWVLLPVRRGTAPPGERRRRRALPETSQAGRAAKPSTPNALPKTRARKAAALEAIAQEAAAQEAVAQDESR